MQNITREVVLSEQHHILNKSKNTLWVQSNYSSL